MTAMKEAPPRAAAFRVVFSDGEREVDIGEVTVNPVLAFKKFQFVISDMIGVSPHQIALFLVRQRRARGAGDARRKIPIDEGTDFGAMAREKDCVVLAQLKRTRRDRRGRARRGHGGGEGYVLLELEKDHVQVPPEKTILRRPTTKLFGGASPMAGVLPTVDNSQLMGMFNYEGPRILQPQHERYLHSPAAMALYRYGGAAAKPLYDLDRLGRPDVETMGAAVCGVCAASWEEPPLFHCCVHDRIVTGGFRTRVGPIERPRKARLQHLA